MYEVGTPLTGGLVGVATLAYTGFNTLAYVAAAAALLLTGLLLLRAHTLRTRTNKP